MKTAAEVKDDQGRTLCGPGVELDTSLLDKFQKMGVRYLIVEGHPVELPWERPLEEQLRLLEERFSRTQDPHPLMIKEVIREFWLKSCGET